MSFFFTWQPQQTSNAIPADAYVTEDGTDAYVTEDGSTNYKDET